MVLGQGQAASQEEQAPLPSPAVALAAGAGQGCVTSGLCSRARDQVLAEAARFPSRSLEAGVSRGRRGEREAWLQAVSWSWPSGRAWSFTTPGLTSAWFEGVLGGSPRQRCLCAAGSPPCWSLRCGSQRSASGTFSLCPQCQDFCNWAQTPALSYPVLDPQGRCCPGTLALLGEWLCHPHVDRGHRANQLHCSKRDHAMVGR